MNYAIYWISHEIPLLPHWSWMFDVLVTVMGSVRYTPPEQCSPHMCPVTVMQPASAQHTTVFFVFLEDNLEWCDWAAVTKCSVAMWPVTCEPCDCREKVAGLHHQDESSPPPSPLPLPPPPLSRLRWGWSWRVTSSSSTSRQEARQVNISTSVIRGSFQIRTQFCFGVGSPSVSHPGN